ncbi:MAG: transporter substrate-binding domain-containing protein [Alphaproteobacteria bacterium]|nr:transporter substrate-binding domain-containing protein [Alphaproteobacteria bacterium]
MRAVHFLLSLCIVAIADSAAAQPTLDVVKKRGQVVCGINGQLPGFSTQNDRKEWVGFEIEFCRALAAAALGEATKAQFVPLTAAERFNALRERKIDVLVRNSTITLSRTAGTGVHDAVLLFIDGQSVAVRKNLGIASLTGLAGKSICILKGTPYQPEIAEWFADRKLSFTPVMFDTQTAMYQAFYDGKCDGITQDVSALASTIVASGRAAEFMMLPEIVAKDPLGAYVRDNDEAWENVVRWTLNALLEAEERGITSGNATTLRDSGPVGTRRFLGGEPGVGKGLGLADSWAFDIIKQVGNYSEIYERNLGGYSALKFPRGINALWNNGGVMYPMPVR